MPAGIETLLQKEAQPEQFDPIENNPRYIEIADTVDEMAKEAAIEDHKQHFPDVHVSPSNFGMGFCHVIWRHKKRILKEQYGIDWKSPAEMNPHIWYD